MFRSLLGVGLCCCVGLSCRVEADGTVSPSSAPAQSPAPTVQPSAQEPQASPVAVSPSDAEAARQLVLDYKAAILDRDGERAADLASSSTHAYYDKLRSDALHASASEVQGRGPLTQLLVLSVRVRMSEPELQGTDGRGLFVHAVEQGWIGEEARQVEPAGVSVDGDIAQIGLRISGQTLPPSSGFRAVREEGRWKLDVMSITNLAEPALVQLLEGLGPDRNQAILEILTEAMGRELTAEVWNPLVTQR